MKLNNKITFENHLNLESLDLRSLNLTWKITLHRY